MKTKFLLIVGGVVAVVAGSVVAVAPRHYYRYDGISVSVVSGNACWNGLSRGPCVEFKVPIFRDARLWRPAPAQVRRALKDSKLSDGEVAKVIEACVSLDEQYNGKSEPHGAANRSEPIRPETNGASSAPGPGG
jgi:hypothetical protein